MKKNYYTYVPFSAVKVLGKDSKSFLQRVMSIQMKFVMPNQASRGLLLSGSGRISAAFTLLCEDENTYLLIAKSIIAQNLAAELENFHFNEDLTISECKGFGFFVFGEHSFDLFDEKILSSSALNSNIVRNDDYTIFPWLASSTGKGFIWPVIDYHSAYDSFFLGDQVLKEKIETSFMQKGGILLQDDNFWEYQRITIMMPKFQKEWDFDSMPLNVGFHTWIHRNKGCYPGQEVIERTFNVGHPPLVLVQITGFSDVPQEKTRIYNQNEEIGTLTSLAVDPFSKDCIGLGLVRWNYRFPQTKVTLENGIEAMISKYSYQN